MLHLLGTFVAAGFLVCFCVVVDSSVAVVVVDSSVAVVVVAGCYQKRRMMAVLW